MDFEIPQEIRAKLAELDAFIEREIAPLEREHPQFFDHRRENARTNWEADGTPRREWEELLAEMRRRADRAGHLRFALPKELGGQGGSNLAMAIIRELACNAADLAMRVHRGIGYTRSKPFEHIYRHHRRYRITEGSDEVQLRKIAGHLFGFTGTGRG
jgi:alkylation response protein AidB-like acyl-CoA dehydrogenase